MADHPKAGTPQWYAALAELRTAAREGLQRLDERDKNNERKDKN
ncbi:hypothetical protein [Couchioplanes caeruleus]|uniref:Uncharacterized protein n=1 Tax=Couchioplanes caeruleus TaxID=56438 RepID=A0A3N1GGW5_9ACTN|nr:hypothetical protein [Couchioplanes caeruleus]ROP29523.1 hypothetical protein EDD30_2320 [Couchioplanes caeruleus]